MSETIATIGPNKWSSARTGGEEKPVFAYELWPGVPAVVKRRDIPAATQLARMILALLGRNNSTAAKLVFSVIGKMLAFSCVALLANLRVSAAEKDDAASAPMPIACEVRYHFRERIADAKPAKNSSRRQLRNGRHCPRPD